MSHGSRLGRGILIVLALVGASACSGGDPEGGPKDAASPTAASSASQEATKVVVPGLRLDVVATGFAVPRQVASTPGGALLVADQVGVVHVLGTDGAKRIKPFLDITQLVLQPGRDRLENGLNGFVLAPDFARTGTFYTWATRPPRPSDATAVDRVDTLTRWRAGATTLVADPASAEVLLEVPQVHADHAGGMTFGEDGLLYVGVGAGVGDPAAQDRSSLPGSILRLDVSRAGAYRVPADNPFVGGTGRPEIWSYGYRNPFRLHDAGELGLVVAEPMFREKNQQISVATKGANAGYPELPGKGPACWVDGALAVGCGQGSGIAGLVPPVMEYPAAVGRIVSGAVISRQSRIEGLRDKVLVSDWEGAFLLATPGPAPWRSESLTLDLPAQFRGATVWALDVDARGEIYVLVTDDASSAGAVLRLHD